MNSIADKTIFTFIDDAGEKTTLTFDKSVADALQKCVDNVHAWIQTEYDEIIAGKKNIARYIKASKMRGEDLSRRSIGDIIRTVAMLRVMSEIDDAEW